jgi:hypothetical protein
MNSCENITDNDMKEIAWIKECQVIQIDTFIPTSNIVQ